MPENAAIAELKSSVAVLCDRSKSVTDALTLHAEQSRETLVMVTQIAAKQTEIAAAIEQNRLARIQTDEQNRINQARTDERLNLVNIEHNTLKTKVETTWKNTLAFSGFIGVCAGAVIEGLKWFGSTIGVTTPHH
jgi:flagellar capping protein FliD